MAGAERTLLIKFIGESKSLESAAKRSDQAVDQVGLSLGNLAKAGAFTALAASAARFAKASVSAAFEDQQAQVQLALALRNSVGAREDVISATETYIAKLQGEVGILDDELRPAYSTLVRATKDVAASNDLLALAADVSIGKGKDLATVSGALAKAYQGNYKGLKDLGVELKNADGSAKSFAQISKELIALYGGSAKAAFDADPAKQLQVQLENLKETVGGALVPVVKTFSGVLEDVLGWFNDLDPAAQQTIVWIGLIGGGAVAAMKGFSGMVQALQALGVTAAVSTPWLVASGAAIAGVIAVVSWFSDETEVNTEKQDAFNTSVRQSAAGVDIQRIALLSAADAARLYREEVFANADKELRDKIAADQDMVDIMKTMGFTMEEVIAASHDLGLAQAAIGKLTANNANYQRNGVTLTDAQRKGYIALRQTLDQGITSYQASLDANVALAKVGDLVAISYLKQTGNLGLLTDAEREAAEATLDKASADDKAAAASEAASDAAIDQAAAEREQATAAREAEAAAKSLADAKLGLVNSDIAARKASDDYTTSLENFAVAKDDTLTGVNEITQAQDAAALAALGVANANVKLAQDQATLNGTTLTAAQATQIQIDSLMWLANSLAPDSPLRLQLLGYVEQLKATPPAVTTAINADTTDALDRIGGVAAAVDEIAPEIETTATADTDEAEGDIEDLSGGIEDVPDEIVTTARVEVDGAIGNLQRLRTELQKTIDKARELERMLNRVAD